MIKVLKSSLSWMKVKYKQIWRVPLLLRYLPGVKYCHIRQKNLPTCRYVQKCGMCVGVCIHMFVYFPASVLMPINIFALFSLSCVDATAADAVWVYVTVTALLGSYLAHHLKNKSNLDKLDWQQRTQSLHWGHWSRFYSLKCKVLCTVHGIDVFNVNFVKKYSKGKWCSEVWFSFN